MPYIDITYIVAIIDIIIYLCQKILLMAKKPIPLYLDEQLKNKMFYIVWADRKPSFNSEVAKLIQKEVDRYEKANGAITDKELKEARIIG